MRRYNFIITVVLLASGCASEVTQQRQSVTVNHAHGKVNQVLVIADGSLWEGAVGDTFFYYFSAPYLMLPQPESIFDIIFMTPVELAQQSVKKEFRTILFLADMENATSATAELVADDVGPEKLLESQTSKGASTITGKDKWAREQTLIYVFGWGEDKLKEHIAKSFTSIAKKINAADLASVEANAYQAGENIDLRSEIKGRYGINLKVPGDFKKAKQDNKSNTIWLRRDNREINANLIIHSRPYINKSQLTKEGAKAIRDEIGSIVSTHQPNTYMRINDTDLPMFSESININNIFTLQSKGIWEIANDFMGGPYVSNLMLSPDKKTLVLVDGFIYAPGKDKRNFMQEMELILSSANF